MSYKIRLATENDAQVVHDIYGAYVPLDYVTFTVDNPNVESYRQIWRANLNIQRCQYIEVDILRAD